jgi:hypothetical protein
MGEASYHAVRKGKTWGIDRDGNVEGDYATKEAAFEAAFAAASNAIKDGMGVTISVPKRAPGESAVGGRP